MNKSQLIQRFQNRFGVSESKAREMIHEVFDGIEAGLRSPAGEVALRPFGKFVRKHRAARKGHNPQTGDMIDIPASDTVIFRPSKELKESVNNRRRAYY